MFGSKNAGGLNNLPPKTSFFLGLISGFLVVCAIGFFVLLGVFLNKKDGSDNNDNNIIVNQNANVNQNGANPTQPTQPDQGSLAKNLKPITAQDHIRGNKSAKVVMIEFSDFQCPFCSRVHPTLQKLYNDYKGQVAWVYKHFPLDGLHPYARKAAEASECANEQGKFWEYADQLYANQSSFGDNYFGQLAQTLGLDANKFNSCLSSNKYANLVNDNSQEGNSVGITGTPGIYVNDQLVKGALPYENFKQIIDSLLSK
jgi:protein-disulfide isomerase